MLKYFLQLKPLLTNSKSSLILVLILAVGIGYLTGTSFRYPDEVDYHQLAESLLAGEGFQNPEGDVTAFRPPGYPFFLRTLYSIWHNPQFAKGIQALLLAGTAWIMVRLLRREGGIWLGLPGVMLMAYPVLIYTATTLYPQTLAGFLLLLLLALLAYPNSLWKIGLAGLTLGYLILCIPAFMLTAPFLALCLWLMSSAPFPRRFLQVCLLTFCSLLVVVPWTYRNYRVFDSLVPVSTNSGLNLFFGNSPRTLPSSGVNVDRSHLLPLLEDLNEVERDRAYRDLALEWLRENPGSAIRLYAGKALHYFHFHNRLATASETSTLNDAVLLATWAPLCLLFFIRPFFHKRFPFSPLERSLYILVLTNVFLSAIFFTRIRFRLPFDLLMILGNSLFVDRVWRGRILRRNPGHDSGIRHGKHAGHSL